MSSPANGGDQAYVQPRAGWRVTLDGKDLTARLAPRLIGLTLSERGGESSDQLEITLHDHDGQLVLPREGALLEVQLGWERGSVVLVGLVPKGAFTVDELEWRGPPDTVVIRGRSADLKDSFRTRKTRIWKDAALGEIIGRIASDNGLAARCHPDLANVAVSVAEQANKSDMNFLRDLGRRYDAIATVKNRALIFSPVNATTTPGGATLPMVTVTRSLGDRYSYRRAERERAQDGTEAQWHDQDGAERKNARVGGGRRRRLKRVYASQQDADAAARSEANRQKRAEATMEITLAHGDPGLAPGARARAEGFKSEVDAKLWRIAAAEHRMDGQGLTTRLEMEVAG